MILLVGGTTETYSAAEQLLAAGFQLLVSTATDEALPLPDSPRLERRYGRLDEAGFRYLLKSRGIRAVVDVTHPYATEVQKTVRALASAEGLPYLRYQRPGQDQYPSGTEFAATHSAAAALAVDGRKPILLTIGSRHVQPYADAARSAGLRCLARILPREESRRACREAELPAEDIIEGRGPFSVNDTVDLIRRHRIGTLVTKDSGTAGGVPEKIEAARITQTKLIVVQRPDETEDHLFHSIESMVGELSRCEVR